MSPALSFDRVVVVAMGVRRELSVDEFLALPLHERVRFVLARQLEFFRAGEPVDRRAALDTLRQRDRAA